jgi:hypothetical protein
MLVLALKGAVATTRLAVTMAAKRSVDLRVLIIILAQIRAMEHWIFVRTMPNRSVPRGSKLVY